MGIPASFRAITPGLAFLDNPVACATIQTTGQTFGRTSGQKSGQLDSMEVRHGRRRVHHLLRFSLTLRVQRSRVAVDGKGDHGKGH